MRQWINGNMKLFSRGNTRINEWKVLPLKKLEVCIFPSEWRVWCDHSVAWAVTFRRQDKSCHDDGHSNWSRISSSCLLCSYVWNRCQFTFFVCSTWRKELIKWPPIGTISPTSGENRSPNCQNNRDNQRRVAREWRLEFLCSVSEFLRLPSIELQAWGGIWTTGTSVFQSVLQVMVIFRAQYPLADI